MFTIKGEESMSTIILLVSVLFGSLVVMPVGIFIANRKIQYNLQSPKASVRTVYIHANTFQEAKNIAELSYPGWRAISSRRAELGKNWRVRIKLIKKRKGYH